MKTNKEDKKEKKTKVNRLNTTTIYRNQEENKRNKLVGKTAIVKGKIVIDSRLENLAGKITYAQFLSDGSEIKYKEDSEKGTVTFTLPTVPPVGISPVIEIILK